MAYHSTTPSNARSFLSELDLPSDEELEDDANALSYFRDFKDLVERSLTPDQVYSYHDLLVTVLEDDELRSDLVGSLFTDYVNDIKDHSDFEDLAKTWAESNGYEEASDDS